MESKAFKYKGEIENVIFFNTPHEGTGFADQVLLNGSGDRKGDLYTRNGKCNWYAPCLFVQWNMERGRTFCFNFKLHIHTRKLPCSPSRE